MKWKRYHIDYQQVWDDAVTQARNGHFMFMRRFMDYHKDRFPDASMIFYDEHDKVIGLLPATYNAENQCFSTHNGLTFGGLVLMPKTRTPQVMEMFGEMMDFARNLGAKTLIYKQIPHIYHQNCSDEDSYALFKNGAHLTSCGLSTTVTLPYSISELRRRKVKLAENQQVKLEKSENYEDFWKILQNVLKERHDVRPVHSVEEIMLLAHNFPENIELHVAKLDGEVVAGTVLFINGKVIHTQYLAASEKGRETGALDDLLSHLLKTRDYEFFDFGISTEDGGKILNDGLLFQKEGFGGHGICYKTYEIKL